MHEHVDAPGVDVELGPQVSHADCPVYALKVFSGQGRHSETDRAKGVGRYVPTGHAVGLPDCMGQ